MIAFLHSGCVRQDLLENIERPARGVGIYKGSLVQKTPYDYIYIYKYIARFGRRREIHSRNIIVHGLSRIVQICISLPISILYKYVYTIGYTSFVGFTSLRAGEHNVLCSRPAYQNLFKISKWFAHDIWNSPIHPIDTVSIGMRHIVMIIYLILTLLTVGEIYFFKNDCLFPWLIH